MVPQQTEDVARQAVLLYHQQLKDKLESAHRDQFVAIEPVSGEYFLGRTLSEAVNAALEAYPDRLTHVVRVGHQAGVLL